MNKFYITTAIPYVNANPHIGFALELIQADVLAGYHRLLGDDTHFLNGTDDNALKNVQAAEKAGVPVKEFVDQHAQKFVDLSKELNISNDDFVRTTEERHVLSAQKLWLACENAGDIYKKKYKGLYCVGCEGFKTKKELVGGLCPEHRTKPEEVEEENYFFKLSKYEKQLLKLVESGEIKIIPSSRGNEVIEFIKNGLEDFSISRSLIRARGWGIDVPGDSEQKIYVWFDALVNYISALGYAENGDLFKKFWQENNQRCHLIGKGITRFHAVYWPALLLSAGLLPPSNIYVHGYVTVDGEKISKSLGNVIDPFVVTNKYGVDPVRYFLLREISSTEDGDFSYKKLEDRYNGDLANGLGNLVQRVAVLISDKLNGELIYNESLIEGEVKNKAAEVGEIVKQKIESFELHESLSALWSLVIYANRYIDDKKPWAAIKHDEKEFLVIMTNLLYLLHSITGLLQPFLPGTSQKIADIFGDDLSFRQNPDKYHFHIKKTQPLFPRLQ